MSAVPIILCGRKASLAQAVRHHLMPEYDVIHIVSSPEAGTRDLPLLLASTPAVPPNSQPNLGSRNYAKRPTAVVVGGGFDDEMFKQMRNACREVTDVPWGRANLMKGGEMPDYNDVEAFGKVVARRIKASLLELGVGRKTRVEGDEFEY